MKQILRQSVAFCNELIVLVLYFYIIYFTDYIFFCFVCLVFYY